MYKISIFNKGFETVIHYPSADSDTPKIINQKLNKKRGQAGSLSFSILTNNKGYNLITRMSTLVTVIDVRDNKEVFNGRVYTVKSSMDDKGLFKKDVICEGELNYLHDTVVDSNIYEDKTPLQLLTTFLNTHNSKVEDYKKIYLGIVDVDDWLFCTTNLETTLDAIIKYIYKEELGYLQLRKVNGVKYLDYLKTTSDKIVNVELTKNMLDLMQTDDKDFGTRIVPIGANGLTIESVNNGKNYLEDAVAVAEYGIIYKTVEYKNIESDTELKTQCQAQLTNYTTTKKTLEVGAIDLATLANTSVDMIDENTSVHMVNQVMDIDEVWKVVEYDVDLTEAWKPKLTISNKPTTLSGTLNSIIGSMVRNDGDYNGVQIGDSFGLRIKNDLVKLLLNAKDGISIENDSKKIFYVDTNGRLRAVDGIFDNITANNMTANYGTYNNIVANLMKTSNTTNYIIMHDQYIEFYHNNEKIIKLGFDSNISSPSIMFYKNYDGLHEAGFGMDSFGNLIATGNISFENTINFQSSAKKGGQEIATEEWVNSQGFSTGTYATQYDIDVAIFLHEQRYHA